MNSKFLAIILFCTSAAVTFAPQPAIAQNGQAANQQPNSATGGATAPSAGKSTGVAVGAGVSDSGMTGNSSGQNIQKDSARRTEETQTKDDSVPPKDREYANKNVGNPSNPVAMIWIALIVLAVVGGIFYAKRSKRNNNRA